MGKVSKNIADIKSEIGNEKVALVAISKTKPASMIEEAYDFGHLDFGENKAQELSEKSENLPKEIRWHFVGHLQRNKVKYIAPFVHLIHSVDSLRLLKAINKEGEKNDRIIDCLLQVHIAEESTKFGFDEKELIELLNDTDLSTLRHVKITGLMGMATFTEDTKQIKREFSGLKKLFDELATNYKLANVDFQELSMGMSGDYTIAIGCGSTMVRIGSSIFGERNYA